MNYQNVVFFKHISVNTPIETIKAQYLELCKKHHPDMGGSTADMQQINAEYMYLSSTHSHIHLNAKGETYEKYDSEPEMPERFMDLINALLGYKGITVEVIGRFVWVGGNTKAIKENLKALGLQFSGSRKMWYYTPVKGHKWNSKMSFDQIRAMYGSSFRKETEAAMSIE